MGPLIRSPTGAPPLRAYLQVRRLKGRSAFTIERLVRDGMQSNQGKLPVDAYALEWDSAHRPRHGHEIWGHFRSHRLRRLEDLSNVASWIALTRGRPDQVLDVSGRTRRPSPRAVRARRAAALAHRPRSPARASVQRGTSDLGARLRALPRRSPLAPPGRRRVRTQRRSARRARTVKDLVENPIRAKLRASRPGSADPSPRSLSSSAASFDSGAQIPPAAQPARRKRHRRESGGAGKSSLFRPDQSSFMIVPTPWPSPI